MQPPTQNKQEALARFTLESAQCELLLAFEQASSLSELSSLLLRDVSVVSRQLQRLAEAAPVIEKRKGKWHLTELGKQMNHWSRSAASAQAKILQQHESLRFSQKQLPSLRETAALLLVGVQNGFQDPIWGARNNLDADEKIESLLAFWRENRGPIYHIQHRSNQSQSPLKAGTLGSDFRPYAVPQENETIVAKSVNSAFVGTELSEQLRKQKIETLVVVGYSTNHCIDATVRTGADLGFHMYVVSDAIVGFDRIGPDGNRIPANVIHQSVMANLSQEFAVVVSTEDILRPNKYIDA